MLRERRLLEPAVRRSEEAVLSLLHEDFREFGASGRIWDRQSMATALSADPGVAVNAHDMHGARLGDNVVLVTYVAETAGRVSLRSSVWRRGDDGWRLFFHQGTPRC